MTIFLSYILLVMIASTALFAQQKQLGQSFNTAITVKNNFVKRETCYSFLAPQDSVIYCDIYFDTLGNKVLARSFTIAGHLVDVDTLLYRNGKLEKELQYDSTGTLSHKILYLYNDNNKLYAINKYDSSGRLVYSGRQNYDDDGNITLVYEKTDSAVESITRLEFDENHRNIRTTYDTGEFKVLEHKYNKNNQLILTRSKNELSEMTIRFFYNKKKLWVKRKYQMKTSRQKNKIFTEEKFSYYPNDLFFEKLYYENGSLKGKLKSCYSFYK